MPAQQLPWFRFWKGATQHDKTRQLGDAEFRTWVELLDLASQQKWRGRFSSQKAAVALVRRPAKHVKTLIEVGLIDEDATDKHLTMHDWDDWKRWRKEDTNDSGTTHEGPPDHPTNGLAIDYPTTKGTTPEGLHEQHTPSSREEERVKNTDLREESLDVETEDEEKRDERLKGAASRKTRSAPRGNPRVQAVIEAFRELNVEPMMGPRDYAAIKASNVPPALVVEVFLAVSQKLYGDDFMRKQLSVHNAIDWAGGYVQECLESAIQCGEYEDEKDRLRGLGWRQPKDLTA